MARLTMQRIQLGHPNAAEQLAHLRVQLSAQGNVVSARGRELTERVFGEALPPARVVERICEDVRKRGREAVFHYTEQFDRVRLDVDTLRVDRAEMAAAHVEADPALLETVRRVRQNVLSFQLGLLHRTARLVVPGRHELRLRYRPMRRVGVLVPGGAAAYPSTLLMTICPAQAAGVKELAVVMPPTKNGAYNKDLLAVCHELGVREVYRVGGAQAVASLAYGIEGLPAVDMIVGPGNLFVALAKRYVFGQVAIDCIAGPSEVVVLADASAPPAFVAADLIAQAEHAPGASILVTWHAPLLDAVEAALETQLGQLSRGELARESLEQFGALVLARDEKEAAACVNDLAPEHLHIATENAEKLCEGIDNAGAIFLGHYTPVAVGDYAAGLSHVLPTGGTARFTSGLSANDFLRRSSVLSFTREGLAHMAEDVLRLAQHEGLTGHAASVEVRLQK
ncbi:MAG TPA: histidinol dehydrogenase [Gemmataceae bacterium]|nr:histidinol dehydrogenase [Gemmataceae bacterium]